jgi:hypothetical protein
LFLTVTLTRSRLSAAQVTLLPCREITLNMSTRQSGIAAAVLCNRNSFLFPCTVVLHSPSMHQSPAHRTAGNRRESIVKYHIKQKPNDSEGKTAVLAGPSHTEMVFCLGAPIQQLADASLPCLQSCNNSNRHLWRNNALLTM